MGTEVASADVGAVDGGTAIGVGTAGTREALSRCGTTTGVGTAGPERKGPIFLFQTAPGPPLLEESDPNVNSP
ncbi:unnamed protein product [Cuscuta campestris]|uniref:Uncharacterized protein n=1 Tax=Cuscuta campestris TaxID=132261 RepID=A0A484MM91_9ASTE|nr:unnamed protein product [Cuscuta campestris]